MKLIVRALAFTGLAALFAAAQSSQTLLPTGWRLSAPQGAFVTVGTMPQGVALSPDARRIAVVEAGAGPPGLRILNVPALEGARDVKLKGAFGRPIWLDDATVAVAGGNEDALDIVDVNSGNVRRIATGSGSWPAAIALAPGGRVMAVAGDGDSKVALVDLKAAAVTKRFPSGAHPSAVAFSADGATLYTLSRAESNLRVIQISDAAVRTAALGRHPAAMAFDASGRYLLIVASDDDELEVFDTQMERIVGRTRFSLPFGGEWGTLPNAVAVFGKDIYVTLAGANGVARLRFTPPQLSAPATARTGWYPTDVAVTPDGTLFVTDGMGEGTRPNPQYNPYLHRNQGYVAEQRYGTVRAIDGMSLDGTGGGMALLAENAAPQWTLPTQQTVVRPGGPIRHVIYIIKENRSYDQVLGDVRGANGDPQLVWFGEKVTPNQHAIARRFGIFDNAYVDAEVSADGHNWSDAAIANDYTERFWPATYGGRREAYDYDFGVGPNVPRGGYLWDAAAKAHITYRNYGEGVVELSSRLPPITTHRHLVGHYDPRYVGWNLRYSDLDRLAEWRREFNEYTKEGDLPALEVLWLPNDHTAGTAPGRPTPQAYVAQNDLAVGRLVDAVSHSRYWKSTAIFILEDDAQAGPDHVSDQRSTFYVASPYARGGLRHEHYSTAGVLATIERILGLRPLSYYDATSAPLYEAFGSTPNVRPYDAVVPKVNPHALNRATAYGAATSARLDFSRPDAADPRILQDVLAHGV
ncbi:MAG TPA: beta-propeller fold lactonase family protein [Candidatus Baltobacteraceae bacterium]|nr:beta-propeller fold lactonase family protein [Candidatus Baltobacteraceae bacterium]